MEGCCVGGCWVESMGMEWTSAAKLTSRMFSKLASGSGAPDGLVAGSRLQPVPLVAGLSAQHGMRSVRWMVHNALNARARSTVPAATGNPRAQAPHRTPNRNKPLRPAQQAHQQVHCSCQLRAVLAQRFVAGDEHAVHRAVLEVHHLGRSWASQGRSVIELA